MGLKEWINRRRILRRVLGALGLHIPEGREDVLHLSRKILRTLGIGLVVLLFLGLGFIRFSTSPYFCGTCHIMRPYYKAWKESKHNFVPCVDCHYPPGFTEEIRGKFQASVQVVKYLTKTYSTLPYAEIDDASCLRKGCHSRRLLEGRVPFKKGVIFDHKPHLTELRRGRRLRCTTCHSQIVVGTHIAVTESVCFICHFKPEADGSPSPNAKCTICHEAPKGDIELSGLTYNHKDFVARGVECQRCHVDVIQGKGEVPRQACFTCHNEPERLAKMSDHAFIHEWHVTKHKVECFRCHSDITHRVTTSMDFMKMDCVACHSGMHEAQKMLYMGEGGKGVDKMPSVMFLARVGCTGCHIAPREKGAMAQFHGVSLMTPEASCLNCHGKEYKGILEDWKKTVSTSLEDVRAKIAHARKLIERGQGSLTALQEAGGLLDEAQFNCDLVRYGRGVHNVQYSDALLSKAKEDLEKISVLLK